MPLVDTWRVRYPDEALSGTISCFRDRRDARKIDYIMTPPDVQVLAAEIVRVHRKGRYPSDHYPVTARLRF